jgi:hypothetical protein
VYEGIAGFLRQQAKLQSAGGVGRSSPVASPRSNPSPPRRVLPSAPDSGVAP